ncbi:MAG: DEAD/DEAH box helicase [Clostridiales bacterium]|nr:DEAD/DEAH box helicase [Clostridiales bacterium]
MIETMKFTEFGLSSKILKIIDQKGFEEATPIQTKMIPLLIGRDTDVIAKAQTGTGKTAAFGIPLLDKLVFNKQPKVLVITPTRELAIQVSEELNSLKPSKDMRIMPVYGGSSMDMQLKALRSGLDIVVGTPGRVMDHMRRNKNLFSSIDYLVLDEADEMLSMGFIEDIEFIISQSNAEKNILLLSATMPKEIVNLSKRFLKEPERIEIQSKQLTTELTRQIYFEVKSNDKLESLCRIIDIENEFYGIIFCRTKNDTDAVSNQLVERGYDAEALHGDISQNQRERIFKKFKSKNVNILVATDVAARGIDVSGLTHVINYSIPQDPESYVHRIGRTGRAGLEGTAITFVTPSEYKKLHFITQATKTSIEKAKIPKIDDVIVMKQNHILTTIDVSVGNYKEDVYYQMAEKLMEEYDTKEAIATLLKLSYNEELDPNQYAQISEVELNKSGKARLFIAKGKMDNFDKTALIKYIVQESGVKSNKIRDVRVLDKFSFITVGFKEAEEIVKAFKNKKVGRKKIIEYAKN